MKRRQKLVVGLVMAAMFVLLCGIAQAGPLRLRLEDMGTGVGVVITDGGAGDSNLSLGAITYIGSVGSFVINVTTGISKPTWNHLDLNSVDVSSLTGGTLRISLEDGDYVLPANGPAKVVGAVGGTFALDPLLPPPPIGSKATFQSWVNALNAYPNYGPDSGPVPIALVAQAPAGGGVTAWPGVGFVTPPDPVAFASTSSANWVKSGDYALYAQVDIILTGKGTISFNETQLINSVPEPGVVLLIGMGVAFVSLLSGWKFKN